MTAVCAFGRMVLSPVGWYRVAPVHGETELRISFAPAENPELSYRSLGPGEADDHLASRAGESHPHALPEPYVTLSSHTAPDVRPFACRKRQ